MEVEILPHGDNYIYLIRCGSDVAAVDPGSALVVRRWLQAQDAVLSAILTTHDHFDHTAGVAKLAREYGCRVIGGSNMDATMGCGKAEFEIIPVPGHTLSDVLFFERQSGVVFTGDTLFVAGCGRVFGDHARMWDSLKIVRGLPDETLVFCGHDYTVENLEFALHMEPGNRDVATRLEEMRERSLVGRPTVPSTMAWEKKTNPFLRCDEPSFQEAIGLSGEKPVDVFRDIRRRKDRW